MGRWGFSRHQMNRVIKLLFRTIAQPLKMLCHPVMGILIAYLLAYNWSLWRDTLRVFTVFALYMDLQAVSCCSTNCSVHLGTKTNLGGGWWHIQFYSHNQSIIQGLGAVFVEHLCQTSLSGGEKQVKTNSYCHKETRKKKFKLPNLSLSPSNTLWALYRASVEGAWLCLCVCVHDIFVVSVGFVAGGEGSSSAPLLCERERGEKKGCVEMQLSFWMMVYSALIQQQVADRQFITPTSHTHTFFHSLHRFYGIFKQLS